MPLSRLIGRRYKETPAEASLVSHAFLLRGGYIRPVAAGIFSLLPLGWRVARKIEAIIREEMDRIGVGRLMASIIEVRHDEHGPVWPASVAPFAAELIAVNLIGEQREAFSRPLYDRLLSAGIDVLYDDREERPGVQFADADLIGAPLRLIASARNMAARNVEWKTRGGKGRGVIGEGEVRDFVEDFLRAEG